MMHLSEQTIPATVLAATGVAHVVADVSAVPGLDVVSNVTVIGLLAYILTKTLPNMQQTFRDEQRESRAVHDAEQDKTRALYAAELAKERDMYAAELAKERELFRATIAQVMESGR
jgi:hypothetical protein